MSPQLLDFIYRTAVIKKNANVSNESSDFFYSSFLNFSECIFPKDYDGQ